MKSNKWLNTTFCVMLILLAVFFIAFWPGLFTQHCHIEAPDPPIPYNGGTMTIELREVCEGPLIPVSNNTLSMIYSIGLISLPVNLAVITTGSILHIRFDE